MHLRRLTYLMASLLGLTFVPLQVSADTKSGQAKSRVSSWASTEAPAQRKAREAAEAQQKKLEIERASAKATDSARSSDQVESAFPAVAKSHQDKQAKFGELRDKALIACVPLAGMDMSVQELKDGMTGVKDPQEKSKIEEAGLTLSAVQNRIDAGATGEGVQPPKILDSVQYLGPKSSQEECDFAFNNAVEAKRDLIHSFEGYISFNAIVTQARNAQIADSFGLNKITPYTGLSFAEDHRPTSATKAH